MNAAAEEIKQMNKQRHFLTQLDLAPLELRQIINRATELKAMRDRGEDYRPFVGKTLAMIFEKSSTRTRVSFEAGMTQFGGNAMFLSPRDTQLGRGEPIEDTARVLSRMVDCVMIRTFDHADIYGGYTTEAAFVTALQHSGASRENLDLISKCGIQYLCEARPNRVKHYQYDKAYIVWSAEQSLRNLQTDYLDLLRRCRVCELSGGVDFDAATRTCLQILKQEETTAA